MLTLLQCAFTWNDSIFLDKNNSLGKIQEQSPQTGLLILVSSFLHLLKILTLRVSWKKFNSQILLFLLSWGKRSEPQREGLFKMVIWILRLTNILVFFLFEAVPLKLNLFYSWSWWFRAVKYNTLCFDLPPCIGH